jgi:hypothetical protein
MLTAAVEGVHADDSEDTTEDNALLVCGLFKLLV